MTQQNDDQREPADEVNTPCRSSELGEVRHFEANKFVVICCLPNSGEVHFTTGFFTSEIATRYARGVIEEGGFVFRVLPVGALIAALSHSRVKQQPYEVEGLKKRETTHYRPKNWDGEF